MKTYRSEQHGFEIDVPDQWLLPRGKSLFTAFGHQVAFWCGADEGFNIQIGRTIPEPLDQTEREFTRYALGRQYDDLEFGRMAIGDRDHVWARYRMGTGDWAKVKKYLVVFGETEYAITACCLDEGRFAERERTWDAVAASFRLITPAGREPSTTRIERMKRAARYMERGYAHFRSGRYRKALQQFEKGKMVTQEVTWNLLGVSMTLMQMLVMGAVPEDEVQSALLRAERNLELCLLVAPNDPVYLEAKQAIEDFKREHGLGSSAQHEKQIGTRRP